MQIRQIPTKNLLSKSKIPGVDYVINPYVGCPHNCIYCYAVYMRKFSGHTEPWGSFVDIKQPLTPLKPALLFHAHVMLCSTTDPYNPLEEQYQLTRRILEQLAQNQSYVSILTKSDLVVRDIDLLKKLERCEVVFSFSSVDELVCRQLEPGTASPLKRIRALEQIHQAGISTAVMAAPLLPGISDWQSIITATQAYTNEYRFDRLNLKSGFQKKVITFIAENYPHLLPLYSEIYLKENQIYWKQLAQNITTFCQQRQLSFSLYFS